MLQVQIQGEDVQLLADRAIYWLAQKTLIVADLHWGKAAHFRKNGLAVPMNTQQKDETRLAVLIKQTGATHLIIAGDMFHSVENNAVEDFVHWRKQHKVIDVHLVIGNHDIMPIEKYHEIELSVHQEVYDVGPFLISHDEIDKPNKFYIHGHIHPSFCMEGKGRNKNLRLPCYCANTQKLVLPSFGSFTGSHDITNDGYDDIYVIAENQVIKW